ncbi:MAG: acyltransferase [Sphingomonas bacterium]
MSEEKITIKQKRNQAIEMLRIFAAFEIVSYHSMAPFHNLTYSGLIVFLILSPLMDTRYNWGRRRNIGKLSLQFLLPWFFWILIYGVKNIVTHKTFFPSENIAEGLLYGTSPHLWFLPFMFITLAFLNLLKPYFSPIWLFWICVICAALIMATVSVWRLPSLSWSLPFPQWMHAAAPTLIGIALGLIGRIGKTAWLASATIFCALFVALSANLPGIGIPYATGIILTTIITSLPVKWIPRYWNVQPIADCMMGVYLTHILSLYVWGKFTGNGNYLTVFLAFTFSLLAVWLCRKLVPTSRFVLG